MLQERGIFDVPIQGNVDCVALREVLEVNCLESHAAGGPELRPSGGSSIPLTRASRVGVAEEVTLVLMFSNLVKTDTGSSLGVLQPCGLVVGGTLDTVIPVACRNAKAWNVRLETRGDRRSRALRP